MTHAVPHSCDPCGLPYNPVDNARDDWAEHPRFPQQALLLGSHRNFLRISDRLVADSEQLQRAGEQDASEIQASRWLFESWMRAMGSHEHYEEHKLYRFLAQRFGGSFGCLEEQHHALHQARDKVRDAYARADLNALLAALTEHRRILRAHLDHEESVVIPLLLQLQPEEFERYYNTPISLLLANA